MCEFTVFLDGHEDDNIVAESVVKATVKSDAIVMLDSSGKMTKIPNAYITKTDSIMAEMWLKTRA